MNRDQKAAVIEDVAARLKSAEAIFAVDYRGITVAETDALRSELREADATFQIVKNTLTLRALDQVGNDKLNDFMVGPTALTYVKGDVAAAAKALDGFAKKTELLAFKGGQMGDVVVEISQFKELASLPSRQVMYGRLVGMVASPLTGLVTSLNGLIQGLATQLGQIVEKGLIGQGEAGGGAPSVEATAGGEPVSQDDAVVAPTAEPTETTTDAAADPATVEAPKEPEVKAPEEDQTTDADAKPDPQATDTNESPVAESPEQQAKADAEGDPEALTSDSPADADNE